MFKLWLKSTHGVVHSASHLPVDSFNWYPGVLPCASAAALCPGGVAALCLAQWRRRTD